MKLNTDIYLCFSYTFEKFKYFDILNEFIIIGNVIHRIIPFRDTHLYNEFQRDQIDIQKVGIVFVSKIQRYANFLESAKPIHAGVFIYLSALFGIQNVQ